MDAFFDQNTYKKSSWKWSIIKFGKSINWKINFSEIDIINGFNSIEYQNLSEKTQPSYRSKVYSFAKWLGKDIVATKYMWRTKRRLTNLNSFKKYIQHVYDILEGHSKSKVKNKVPSSLMLYGEFAKWDLAFDKSRILTWFESEGFRRLKTSTRYNYLLRLKSFLKLGGKESHYLKTFIKRKKSETEVKVSKFIEKMCILSDGKLMTQKRLLNAINIYLMENGLSIITKMKLTIYLNKLGVRPNRSTKHKGLKSYFGIDLSLRGETLYGNHELATRKKKLNTLKQMGKKLTTKDACVLMNYDPVVQFLKRFMNLKEIKKNFNVLHDLIKGVCKSMSLRSITRQEKVVLSFILYVGIDSYSQEKACNLVGIHPDAIRRFIKKIIPLSLKIIRLTKSKKKEVRKYFLALAGKNNSLNT
ncbi:MAG: hypothetical protein KJI71_00405 [Patescibacteria group bacterium]|nr:hypothetical protein [Patescibacteria group bacterium]